MKKHFLLWALLLVCILPTFAHDFEVDGIYYNFLGGDSVEVTYYGDDQYSAKYMGEISIPSTVEYESKEYKIKQIDNCAFRSCTQLTSVTIPEGITYIGFSAFFYCYNLTGSLALPSTLTSISNEAFYNCHGFTGDLVIPNGVTTIGTNAFAGCSGFDGELVIPSSVTSIGEFAFSGCWSLTGTLTISNKVITIGEGAFSTCTNFDSIIVESDNPFYHSENNCLIETASKILMVGCRNSVIPADGSVTEIAACAFDNCNLTAGLKGELIIPETITTIGYMAFFYCSELTGTLKIPKSVTNIGYCAFSGCSNLEAIEVDKENSVYHSSGNCLIDTQNKALLLGCKNSIIPADGSVTAIEHSAFRDCVDFTGRLVIPESITTIGGFSFFNCTGITSLSLANSVTSIDDSAFQGCTNIQGELILPENIATIGYAAFAFCSKISSIVSKSIIPPTVDATSFYEIPLDIAVSVPCTSLESYQTATSWKNFTDIVGSFDYILTANSTNEEQGTVTISQVPSCETEGVGIVEATPAEGYKFYQWTDGNKENPRTVGVTQDTTFAAMFIPVITDLQIKQPSLILELGDSYYLNTIVEPKNADKSSLVWNSSDADIVSLDGCIATANAIGQATITVTTADKALSATCDIIVVAENMEESDDVVVDPNDKSVDITWTPVSGAAYYVFVVYADENQVTKLCTLTFNALGFLTNIHFMPKKSVANPESHPFNFTVTGLEENTTYGFSMSSYDEEETLITSKVGQFTTTSNTTTNVETLYDNVSTEVRKVLENGTIYILKPNGEKYIVDGQRVL